MNPESTPPPVSNEYPHMADYAAKAVMDRKAWGEQKYGTPLQPFNGRDAIVDAMEEVLDLNVYMQQVLYERTHLANVLELFTRHDPAQGLIRVLFRDNVFMVELATRSLIVVRQNTETNVPPWVAVTPAVYTQLEQAMRDVATAQGRSDANQRVGMFAYACTLMLARQYKYDVTHSHTHIPATLRELFTAAVA